jgi:hypothetical protein
VCTRPEETASLLYGAIEEAIAGLSGNESGSENHER